MQPIGIFGGTFDPVHYGHLRTAFELWQALQLAEVRFLPTGDPPHRDAPLADAALRLAMVRAAIADQPAFVADDRETRREGRSYSVDTLAELRREQFNLPRAAHVAPLARVARSRAHRRGAPPRLEGAHHGPARGADGGARHGRRA